jgi:hypothetical protein
MHAEVDAARASFDSSVSDAINAAAQAAFADFEYTATPASGAGSSCFYSWSVVPSHRTHLLYSTSLKMPICRISNPSPYLSTPLDPTTLRTSSIYVLAATDMPVSSHTSSGDNCGQRHLEAYSSVSHPTCQRPRGTRGRLQLYFRFLSLYLQRRSTMHCPHRNSQVMKLYLALNPAFFFKGTLATSCP